MKTMELLATLRVGGGVNRQRKGNIMAKKTNHYSEIEDIRDDLDSLKTNVVGLSRHIKEDGEAQTRELKKLAFSRWAKMKLTGKDYYDRTEAQVKAQPLKSVALAFGAGMLARTILRKG
jgi:ElaB/YqjD/DUF883 family membrane-anchored ribosome-binding protein